MASCNYVAHWLCSSCILSSLFLVSFFTNGAGFGFLDWAATVIAPSSKAIILCRFVKLPRTGEGTRKKLTEIFEVMSNIYNIKISSYMKLLNPIENGGGGGRGVGVWERSPSLPVSPWNVYRHRNYPPKLSDFYF